MSAICGPLIARRTGVWLLTGVLSVFGSQLAHSLAYRLVAPDQAERTALLAASGHRYLTYAPLAIAIGATLVVVAFLAQVRGLIGGSSRWQPTLWAFALFAPAVFVVQEHLERLVHGRVVPWSTATDSTFLIGLALQLPFALLAYLLACVVLRAAAKVARAVVQTPFSGHACAVSIPAADVWAPRPGVLALGYPTRGPPSSWI